MINIIHNINLRGFHVKITWQRLFCLLPVDIPVYRPPLAALQKSPGINFP